MGDSPSPGDPDTDQTESIGFDEAKRAAERAAYQAAALSYAGSIAEADQPETQNQRFEAAMEVVRNNTSLSQPMSPTHRPDPRETDESYLQFFDIDRWLYSAFGIRDFEFDDTRLGVLAAALANNTTIVGLYHRTDPIPGEDTSIVTEAGARLLLATVPTCSLENVWLEDEPRSGSQSNVLPLGFTANPKNPNLSDQFRVEIMQACWENELLAVAANPPEKDAMDADELFRDLHAQQLADAITANTNIRLIDFSCCHELTVVGAAHLQRAVHGSCIEVAHLPFHEDDDVLQPSGLPYPSDPPWHGEYAAAIARLCCRNKAIRCSIERNRPAQRLLLASLHERSEMQMCISFDLMEFVASRLEESRACPFVSAGYESLESHDEVFAWHTVAETRRRKRRRE